MAGKGEKLIAENRRARHDYHLLDRFEAGVQLTGTEVKSLRDGRVTLGQAYADLRNGEVWLIGAHIDEYAQGNVANHELELLAVLLVPVLAYVLEAETAHERERRTVLRADRGDKAPDAVLAGSPVDERAHDLGRVAAAPVGLEDRVADLDGVGRLDCVDARRPVE